MPAEDLAWDDVAGSIQGLATRLGRGDLVSLLSEEAFAKRLKKIRHEQNSLIDSTGDSALFLAIGFLEWSEAAPHPKAGQPMFAPLVLLHVHLEEERSPEGGKRSFYIQMDLDQPQDNPCLAEKLRQEFSLDLPPLDEEEELDRYLNKVRRAIRTKKEWAVHRGIALGFFNFARYRLWLDLAPDQWPSATGPAHHPVVKAILNGEWLDQKRTVPTDDDVARHQEIKDLPLVLDADSTQYGALLAAAGDLSMVVIGPPGSGKSQTITNLIAIALNQGKKVLFVAQKLAALAVVHRRLEQIRLSPFCLPIFSDKARVTEVHKHLASSIELRRAARNLPEHNSSSAPLAKKLNEHAARLRSLPSGYSEDVSSIIRRAAALTMQVRDLWTTGWNEQLLDLEIPQGQLDSDWISTREQTLHEWHRLKCEVNGIWSDWRPIHLGTLDTPKVEAVGQLLSRAAAALASHSQVLPEPFRQQSMREIEALLSTVTTENFSPLSDPIPSLTLFLWLHPDSTAAVARLERDLGERTSHLAAAGKHLKVTPDTHSYVAQRAQESLRALEQFIIPGHTLKQAKTALAHLATLLKVFEDLLAAGALFGNGLSLLDTSADARAAQTSLAWRHIDILSRHNTTNPSFGPAINVPLAHHVRDDEERLNAANRFIEQLKSYHATAPRLRASIGELDRFRVSRDRAALQTTADILSRSGFSTATLASLEKLGRQLAAARGALETLATTSAGLLEPSHLGRETFLLADVAAISGLGQVPQDQLLPPPGTIPHLLLRLPGTDLNPHSLREFATQVEQISSFRSQLQPWFPALSLDHRLNSPAVSDWQPHADAICRLGLASQTLASFPQLIRTVADLRQKLMGAAMACAALYNGIPLPPPATVESLRNFHALFKLLVARPCIPDKLPLQNLGPAGNLTLALQALTQSNSISKFRSQHADRIAFRDLPPPDEIARLRRDLRPCAGRWWRWFSAHYRSARRDVYSFLNHPFPQDSNLISLLDLIETHERARLTFEQDPARSRLGDFFKGIDTQWIQLEPVLSWVQQVLNATKLADVTLLIALAVEKPDALQDTIQTIAQGLSAWDAALDDLASIHPLRSFTTGSKEHSLSDIFATLASVEQGLSAISRSIATLPSQQQQYAGKDLVAKVSVLLRFQSDLEALEKHPLLASQSELPCLSPQDIRATSAWLETVSQSQPGLELTRFLAQTQVSEKHLRQLALAAQLASEALSNVKLWLPTDQLPEWLADSSPLATADLSLAEALAAAGKVQEIAAAHCFAPDLQLAEIEGRLAMLAELEHLESLFAPWQDILGEDPTTTSPGDFLETLAFLARLRKMGASGNFLEWLLREQPVSRLESWQELVALAKKLSAAIKDLQAHFILPTRNSAPQPEAWTAELANLSSKAVNALEVLESCSRSDEFSLRDLGHSTNALGRALEIQAGLQEWKNHLGLDPATLKPQRV
ncbi:MAG: DUF4011 domain-containing protein [Verrucomicrobiota bacterium]